VHIFTSDARGAGPRVCWRHLRARRTTAHGHLTHRVACACAICHNLLRPACRPLRTCVEKRTFHLVSSIFHFGNADGDFTDFTTDAKGSQGASRPTSRTATPHLPSHPAGSFERAGAGSRGHPNWSPASLSTLCAPPWTLGLYSHEDHEAIFPFLQGLRTHICPQPTLYPAKSSPRECLTFFFTPFTIFHYLYHSTLKSHQM